MVEFFEKKEIEIIIFFLSYFALGMVLIILILSKIDKKITIKNLNGNKNKFCFCFSSFIFLCFDVLIKISIMKNNFNIFLNFQFCDKVKKQIL